MANATLKRRYESPAQIRSIFGENLKTLCRETGAVAAICRELDINRTQFNRYLSGESFPRPDILAKIWDRFSVDARILLEPLSDLVKTDMADILATELGDFFDPRSSVVPRDNFPSGFYRFTRKSFVDPNLYVQGLILIYRRGSLTFARGLEAKSAFVQQGLPIDHKTREFKGLFVQQDGGLSAIMSRRGSLTVSFNFLSRVPSFENNHWVGYAARTVSEHPQSTRVTRMVYEHIGRFSGEVLKIARTAGFCKQEDLLPFHKTLLQIDQDFR